MGIVINYGIWETTAIWETRCQKLVKGKLQNIYMVMMNVLEGTPKIFTLKELLEVFRGFGTLGTQKGKTLEADPNLEMWQFANA